LGAVDKCAVTIIDNDHGGVFSFERAQYRVDALEEVAELVIVRAKGAKWKVLLPVKTVDGTARNGHDYTAVNMVITFEEEQAELSFMLKE
jgi:solute carrier family 8 (sodium/calcium exchanger)